MIKKYPSLTEELKQLKIRLLQEPHTGTPIGKGVFKIRLGIRSKGKGKSGGGRVITFVITDEKEIWLLDLYDKSEKANIPDSEVTSLIKEVKVQTKPT